MMTGIANDSSHAVWQVSGGPVSRAYADVFLRHGVASIGPGDAGPWSPERSDDTFEDGVVRRFASEVAVGDVFLLRTGLATIAALGLVASDYLYVNAFDDMNGWDLQHARRVRWYRLPADHVFGSSAFGAKPPRCSRVLNEEVVDFAERFLTSPPTHWQTAPLPELPGEEPPLDQVPDALQGIVAQAADLVPLLQDGQAFGEHPSDGSGPELPGEEPPLDQVPDALQGIVAQAADLVPLLQDGQAFGEHPSEDELIVHFVVPFLRALGWPPERIAVQWRHIDVALFRALPRTPENCHLVIEAKRLGAGVEGALDQARGYVEALARPRDVVVTDGIRYRMYAAARDFAPVAYANLTRLKQPATDLFTRMKRQ